jgi:hypothetical protein
MDVDHVAKGGGMKLSQLLRIDDENDALQISEGQFVTGGSAARFQRA